MEKEIVTEKNLITTISVMIAAKGIEKSITKEIIDRYIEATLPMMGEEGLNKQYNTIVQEVEEHGLNDLIIEDAGRIRKELVHVRTDSDKARKKLNDKNASTVKLIVEGTNNANKKIETTIKEMEIYLKGIEKHFENLEIDRLVKLKIIRMEELAKYDYIDIPGVNIEELPEEAYILHRGGVRSAWEARIKVENAATIESDRLANEAAIENNRLVKQIARNKLANDLRNVRKEKIRKREQEKKDKETKIINERVKSLDNCNIYDGNIYNINTQMVIISVLDLLKLEEAEFIIFSKIQNETERSRVKYEERKTKVLLKREARKTLSINRKLSAIREEKQKLENERKLKAGSGIEQLEKLLNDLGKIEIPEINNQKGKEIANSVSTKIKIIKDYLKTQIAIY